jgi:hypothetical protein
MIFNTELTARRVLRDLPLLEGEPDAVRDILAATTGAATHAPPAPARVAPPGRIPAIAAAAACVALAWTGARLGTPAASDAPLTETELARLDAEVEVALVHLGRVLQMAAFEVPAPGAPSTVTE